MPTCAICLIAEATQTGSHLLSAFMVESTVGKRGSEKGYIIDDEPNFDYRINTGAAPIIEDYMFCRGCEQRMAYVEHYVCSEYRDKFKNNSFQTNFKFTNATGYDLQEALYVNYNVFLLFLCTIIYRVSISKKKLFAGFELRPDEQERIRLIIDECLPPYKNFKVKIKRPHFIRDINAKSALFQDLYFVLATYEHLKDETQSFNIADQYYRLPYNFMFGQIVLYFFFTKPRSAAKYLDFFGILSEVDLISVVNGEGANIKTIFLSEEKWHQILDVPRKIIVDNKMPGIMQIFFNEFAKQHSRPPTNDDWLAFTERQFPNPEAGNS